MIKILFIDYLGLIQVESKHNESIYSQVSEITGSIKSPARKIDIPIVCLSQKGRNSEGKPPSLADFRNSELIVKDADVIVFLHKDTIY